MKLFLSVTVVFVMLGGSLALANKKKVNYNQAKKECLQEKPSLKGKALQKCIQLKKKSK